MDNKIYEILQEKLKIYIPTKNDGKFRWKTRNAINDYGKVFSTDKIPYSENSYVEWQIGYDTVTKGKDAKPTTLNNITFRGANNKLKHPYELSEILDGMVSAGIITKKEFEDTIGEINKSYKCIEDEFAIKIIEQGNHNIGNFTCNKHIISLPRFVYQNGKLQPAVEISIEKQQHASGFQAMLYFSIPIQCLENGKSLIGKTRKETSKDYDFFVITKNNKEYILNLFKFFALCSSKHKHDISEILKEINNYIDWNNNPKNIK